VFKSGFNFSTFSFCVIIVFPFASFCHLVVAVMVLPMPPTFWLGRQSFVYHNLSTCWH